MKAIKNIIRENDKTTLLGLFIVATVIVPTLGNVVVHILNGAQSTFGNF